jgi:hypothetical protein
MNKLTSSQRAFAEERFRAEMKPITDGLDKYDVRTNADADRILHYAVLLFTKHQGMKPARIVRKTAEHFKLKLKQHG